MDEILEPDDTGTGFHTAQTYTYDDNGATARRLGTSADALGRTVTNGYDERDRVVQVTYFDGSTEENLYGDNVDPTDAGTANLVIARKDRDGFITTYHYDETGRIETRIVGHDSVDPVTGTILTSYTPPLPTSVPAVAAVYTCVYLDGTGLQAECVNRGEKVSYTYDFRHRSLQMTSHPRTGQTLTSSSTYLDNLLFSSTDPYGRKSFYAYRPSDNAQVRTIQATIPSPAGEPATFAAAEGLARAGTPASPVPNALFLISDNILDAEAQQVATIDPRGVVHTSSFDSRGRTIQTVEAAYEAAAHTVTVPTFDPDSPPGTMLAVAAKSETDYDAISNVTEVRSPRYFDTADTEGENTASSTMTYTRRNLVATRTAAAGADAYVMGDPVKVKVTQSFTYRLDRTSDTSTDFRGNDWTTQWHICCRRPIAQIEPPADVDSDSGTADTRAARITLYSAAGDVAHTGVIADIDNFTQPTGAIGTAGYNTNLPDSETLNEATTRYDERHRPLARTVWLVARGAVDPDNVPIAGLDSVPQSDGLTTRWLYDEDLTDGVGLDNATGISVDKLDGSGTFNVSIAGLLSELTADGTDAGIDSDFYGVVAINPEEEVSVSISDGTGRSVLSGVIESHQTDTGLAANDPVTWSTVEYDSVVTISGFGAGGSTSGDVLETIQRRRTDRTGQPGAVTLVTKSRSDGSGRRSKVRTPRPVSPFLTYDANSNRLTARDPNEVGLDCTYDERNRDTSCTDTQGDNTQRTYDKNNNVLVSTDAKSQTVTCKFDARDRRFECTDRITSVVTWRYDQNSNLLTLTDGDNQTAALPTTYDYDKRNLQTSIEYPGHSGTFTPGSAPPATYDRCVMTYDAARRLATKFDQLGDTLTRVYDLANRLLERQYTADTASPNVPDSGKQNVEKCTA